MLSFENTRYIMLALHVHSAKVSTCIIWRKSGAPALPSSRHHSITPLALNFVTINRYDGAYRKPHSAKSCGFLHLNSRFYGEARHLKEVLLVQNQLRRPNLLLKAR
jgi:hypothetical protein